MEAAVCFTDLPNPVLVQCHPQQPADYHTVKVGQLYLLLE